MALYSAVKQQCSKLLPVGLMTIGKLGGLPDDDFKVKCTTLSYLKKKKGKHTSIFLFESETC